MVSKLTVTPDNATTCADEERSGSGRGVLCPNRDLRPVGTRWGQE